MASAARTLDLEAGPETTPPSTGGTTRASNPDVGGSPSLASSAETTASGSVHHTTRLPVSQIDTASNKNTFTGAFGQALFFVVNTGNLHETAITVPVYRPSVHCARRMERLERGCGNLEVGDDKLQSLLSKPVKKEDWHEVPRWKELRWAHVGEAETDVWERVKQEFDSRRPRWHAFLPFWRVAVVEERDVLLHTRKESTWRVEIKPAVDVQGERRGLATKLTEIWKVLDKYNPDDYHCQGGFDAFGEWYTKWHDNPCCRKGVPIDTDSDEVYRVHGCDVELSEQHQSKQDKLDRLSDFIECLKDPSNATTMFPLTTGCVLNSCIHDNGKINGLPLPDRSAPNRSPPRINCIVIEYRFSGSRMELEIGASSLFVFAVVVIWKLGTGDWSVAAAFGSLCVALMALAHQRGQLVDSHRTKSTKID